MNRMKSGVAATVLGMSLVCVCVWMPDNGVTRRVAVPEGLGVTAARR